MASLSRQAELERQILRLLVRGEKEIAEGRGTDLDTVLAEADELLADCPPQGSRGCRLTLC